MSKSSRAKAKRPQTEKVGGIIERVADNGLFYLRSTHDGRTYSSTPEVIKGGKGKPYEKIGLKEKAPVSFLLDSELPIVTSVEIVSPSTALYNEIRREAKAPFLRKAAGQPQIVAPEGAGIVPRPQSELSPEHAAPKKRISVHRALPATTMAFARLIDTTSLWPGDLLLTRGHENDDPILKWIDRVQGSGGYHPAHAQWTHAAMYLGDGEHIVEATIDNPMSGDVRISSLDGYCDGKSILRFRRSKYIGSERDGWRMCVRALARLKESYSFPRVVEMAVAVLFKGANFSQGVGKKASHRAVICSTLYADAHNDATRMALGEINGACVPAWLSLSKDFHDLKVGWVGIQI